ncbi:hypothetical protein AVDCRST_MAG94-7039, partial [uncultured Leptolyngbya sp.]
VSKATKLSDRSPNFHWFSSSRFCVKQPPPVVYLCGTQI